MRKLLFLALVLNIAVIPLILVAEVEDVRVHLEHSTQVVVVTSTNWMSVPAKLRLFQRSGEKWENIDSWPVVVGRKGLAWGTGLHKSNGEGPIKKEGDGKSPAGLFSLSSAFGIEPIGNSIKLPYLPLSSMIECVDDVKSTNYNLIVDRSNIANPDWNSSEKMKEIGEQYRLGVVVDHNANPRRQGAGSCIFLHIWKDDKTGTAGCTAMASKDMERLITWLDPEKKPLLVQLPELEYERLRKKWNLPNLK